jgi:hypothetical protein
LKPILLLDVDGILNVIGPNNENSRLILKDGHPFHQWIAERPRTHYVATDAFEGGACRSSVFG